MTVRITTSASNFGLMLGSSGASVGNGGNKGMCGIVKEDMLIGSVVVMLSCLVQTLTTLAWQVSMEDEEDEF